jgi:branched-chain amino acid aminotransferase
MEDLLNSDEAFFTGTAVEITPISKIDDQIIGKGLRGPITENLQRNYNDIIFGKNSDYNHWLSLVSN